MIQNRSDCLEQMRRIDKRVTVLTHLIKPAQDRDSRGDLDDRETESLIEWEHEHRQMTDIVMQLDSLRMQCPQEAMKPVDRDVLIKWLGKCTKSFTMAQVIWFWTGFRFGFAHDRYYRMEWKNRYYKHGMEHFLGHMDGDSRYTFKLVLDAWFKYTFRTEVK